MVMSEPGAADELRGLVWGVRRFLRERDQKRRGLGPVEPTLQKAATFLARAGISVRIAGSTHVAGMRLAPALLHNENPIAGFDGKGQHMFVIADLARASPFRTVPNHPGQLCRALVRRHFLLQAVTAARRNLPDDGADIGVDASGRITVSRRDRVVCVIDGVEAEVSGEPVIRGNFLADGRHWERLAEARRRRAQRIVDSRPPTKPRAKRATRPETTAQATPTVSAALEPPPVHIIREPPAGLSSLLVDEVIESSRKIRTERQTAYHFTAHLHLSARERISFHPVEPTPRLRAPFAYRTDAGEVHGEIRLRGGRDPLPVAIEGDVPDQRVAARVWLLALLGFAALTCPAPIESRHAPRRSPQAARGQHRVGPASRPGRARQWSAQLRIRGERGQALPHLVVAHRRELTGGRTASPQAIHAARGVGILLADDETWVRGHSRGAAAVADAHFDWRMPNAHDRLLSRPPGA